MNLNIRLIGHRFVELDGQPYTWDNNGNLLNYSAGTYTYDHANRLKSASEAGVVASYAYNGLGDRVQQTVNGATASYTLDLAYGLTRVLADGTQIYLYGNGRIAQYTGTTPEYFLGDALGSVRQLADASGNVTLTKGYEPYGEVLDSAGNSSTAYGYTGEWTDDIGLVYLRARYYNPTDGRFMTRDRWGGDMNQPMSLNHWIYVEGNPINRIDPSGQWYCQSGFTPMTNDCVSWVKKALQRLESSGTTGKKLAQFFASRDLIFSILGIQSCRPLPQLGGIRIIFEPTITGWEHALAITIWPNQILINSNYQGYNGPIPSLEAIDTFGHEISHLAQGGFLPSLSYQAELLARIVENYLEEEIGSTHNDDGLFILTNQLDPWLRDDVVIYKDFYMTNYPNRLPWLFWGVSGLPRDWLSNWGITLPYPISSDPLPIPLPRPDPVPTPPPPSLTPTPVP